MSHAGDVTRQTGYGEHVLWNDLKGELANGSADMISELLDEMTRVTRRLRRAPALLRAFVIGSELPSPFVG